MLSSWVLLDTAKWNCSPHVRDKQMNGALWRVCFLVHACVFVFFLSFVSSCPSVRLGRGEIQSMLILVSSWKFVCSRALTPLCSPPCSSLQRQHLTWQAASQHKNCQNFSDSSSTCLTRVILRTTASYVWAYFHSHMGLPRTLPLAHSLLFDVHVALAACQVGSDPAQPLLRFCGVLSSFSYFLSHSSHLTKLLITAADMSHHVI